MVAEQLELSEDAILGGRLVLRQPRSGHRVGHDAVLLAAAVSAVAGEHAIDLGAGVGAAGLALARRVEDLSVTLVEIDPALTALARDNAARNGLAHRLRAVCLDVAAPPAAFDKAELAAGMAHHVLMNPPFNTAQQQPSPDQGRRLARTAEPETLRQWMRTAARLLRPAGAVTLIWRADGLDSVLAALTAGFGAVTLLPVHPRPDAAAIRVLIRAVNGSHAPLSLLPGFVLADENGVPTAAAEAVLRGGEALTLARR